jgi:peptide/nickel transport system substrate-binding protein
MRRFTVMLVAAALLAAACSNKKDEESVETSPEAPRETTGGSAGTAAPGATTDEGGTTPAPTTLAPLQPVPTLPASEAEPDYGGKIVIAGEAEVGAPWTPGAVQCDPFCYARALTFYDTLTTLNNELEVVGVLAESFEPNEDHTVFTVKLRKGVKFHDGTPFNADAVIYNFNEAVKSFLVGPALADIARDEDGTPVTEKIDDHTLKIFTGRSGDINDPVPWPKLPGGFGLQIGFMASPTWLEAVKAGTADAKMAIGTGPFKVQSMAPGDKMNVVRNEDYWATSDNGDQLPYLDEIEFRVIPDPLVRESALESGDVDMIATDNGPSLQRLTENDSLRSVIQEQYMETSHVMLHLTKKPLKSRQVRCALLQAIDREQLTELMTGGFHILANGPFSPGQEGFLADPGLPAFDPDAAAAAIEEYEEQNGPVVVNYMTTANSITKIQGQFIVDAWDEIGVDAELTQVEQSELIVNAITGAEVFDAFGWRNHAGYWVDGQTHWWGSRTVSPDGELGLNFARMSDDVIDENLRIARSTTDADERREAAEAINRRFAEQCYLIPAWNPRWGVVYREGLENVGRMPLPDGESFAIPILSGRAPLTATFLSSD